jgi:transcriptional regulator with GAF, ATPase, and Fis domain
MSGRPYLSTLAREPKLAEASLRLLAAPSAPRHDDLASNVVTALGAASAHLMARRADGFLGLFASPLPAGFPASLPIEALDREACVRDDPWFAAPLHPHAAQGELLLVRFAKAISGGELPEQIAAIARLLGDILTRQRGAASDRQRIERLRTILNITHQWNQTQEMEPLLVQMAEAATKLLHADRASIFLWDKPNRTLVGRPALGVEGGELRIPDDKGIVGQVVQTGESRRVDLADNAAQIDRRVDQKLGYETRTLLCVPLRGRNGELFGAFEMINKLDGNFTADDEEALVELAAHAAVALENTDERQKLLTARKQIADETADGIKLIGQSAAIQALRSTIRRVANTDLAIMVLGENGAGKEVVSQAIHYLSNRRYQPFVAINCAAITETLLESELFGHEKGAFTDAHQTRAGKFELASGGTIFLDEIGDLSLAGQAKLLRVLEEKIVVRVGGSTPIHTDARVIAATNQNLADMVRQKRFRQDLYFRLHVVTIELPPLRNRPEDILPLAEYFLEDFCRKARRREPKLSAIARRRLESHTWPGNVRELRNLMERLAYMSEGDKIEAEDLAFILTPSTTARALELADLPLAEATEQYQNEYIRQAIDRNRGNMSEAARQLGLHRSNLYRKMRQLGMPTTE